MVPPVRIDPESLLKDQLTAALHDFVKNGGCSSIFENQGWAKALKKLDLGEVNFRDVNQIQDRLASDFFGNAEGVVPGMSLGTYFNAYAPPGGALTLSPNRSQNHIVGGHSGVYTRGGISSFFGSLGQPNSSYLAHELLHYTTGKDDGALLKDLDVKPREGETPSAALSRYLNGGCKDEDKK